MREDSEVAHAPVTATWPQRFATHEEPGKGSKRVPQSSLMRLRKRSNGSQYKYSLSHQRQQEIHPVRGQRLGAPHTLTLSQVRNRT